MIIDGLGADAEVLGNKLRWLALTDEFQHLALPTGQTLETGEVFGMLRVTGRHGHLLRVRGCLCRFNRNPPPEHQGQYAKGDGHQQCQSDTR